MSKKQLYNNEGYCSEPGQHGKGIAQLQMQGPTYWFQYTHGKDKKDEHD